MNLSPKEKRVWGKAKKCFCGERRKDLSGEHKICPICKKTMIYQNHESNNSELDSNETWTIDYIKPKSLGGTDDVNNLQAVHVHCSQDNKNK